MQFQKQIQDCYLSYGRVFALVLDTLRGNTGIGNLEACGIMDLPLVERTSLVAVMAAGQGFGKGEGLIMEGNILGRQ